MSIEEVKVPVLAESITTAILLNWQKQPGDTVQEGEKLVEIDTDLFILEVNASQAGTLTKIIKINGESVLSEELIAQIEIGSGIMATIPESTVIESAPLSESMPVAPSNTELTVEPTSSIIESNTESVSNDMPISEPTQVSTEEASVEPVSDDVPITQASINESSAKAISDDVPTPESVITVPIIEPSVESVIELNQASTPEIATPKSSTATSTVKTSPAVRKIAAEQDIEPAIVQRHRDDRVTKADMLQHKSVKLEFENSDISEPQSLDVSKSSEIQETILQQQERTARPSKQEPEQNLRPKTIITTFNEINMKAVMDLSDKYKKSFVNKYEVELSFTSFFVKASATALQKFPIINAVIEGDNINYHDCYNIGVAVHSPTDLEFPVLRDVDLMSFVDIEKSLSNFTQQIRDVKLSTDDLNNGTFSVSNHAIFGSMLSTPIPNSSQSAILGMYDIVERPIAENGQIVIRPMMYVALSYDYRLISERDAVQFLLTVKSLVEEPGRLLLGV